MTSFLQVTQASCIYNDYQSDHAITEMKWVNGFFDRGSSYYKINVEVLKDKDYIHDVKKILLEVQVDCENKCNKFQWEYIKMLLCNNS